MRTISVFAIDVDGDGDVDALSASNNDRRHRPRARAAFSRLLDELTPDAPRASAVARTPRDA